MQSSDPSLQFQHADKVIEYVQNFGKEPDENWVESFFSFNPTYRTETFMLYSPNSINK